MKTYTLFNRDGRMAQTVAGAFNLVVAPTLAAWEGYHFEGEYDDTYYFFEGEPQARPDNPTGLSGLKLRNVPPKSTIFVDADSYECLEGGDVTLSFDAPGSYRVIVSCWPYLDGEFDIDYSPQD